MTFIDPKEMEAQKVIAKYREYLDYVSEHIENVRRAFVELTLACDGMLWVGDDATWHELCAEVRKHDLSKLSPQEFFAYRQHFYPVEGEETDKAAFDAAWEHHKANNPHHHESLEKYSDTVHMVVDWTAMGYKFGDTAQSYYEANKDSMNLADGQIALIYEIFGRLAEYRADRERVR